MFRKQYLKFVAIKDNLFSDLRQGKQSNFIMVLQKIPFLNETVKNRTPLVLQISLNFHKNCKRYCFGKCHITPKTLILNHMSVGIYAYHRFKTEFAEILNGM